MSRVHVFLAASFGFLSLLRSAASSHCLEFPKDECQKSTSFVPGHNLIGEGFDITTLRTKGASVVDTSQWQGPNGTCTLCQNPLMGSERQRLPVVVVDWGLRSKCESQVATSVVLSEFGVAEALASEVENNWKVDLELPAIRAAFGGSQSRMTIRAHKYSQRDSYSFINHETYCVNYQLRLPSNPSLLAAHFSQDVSNLPTEYRTKEYQRFIDIYGTHYISQAKLGARRHHLFAVRNCEVALNGFTVSEFKNCLNAEASLGWLWKASSNRFKCFQLWLDNRLGKLQSAFVKWHLAVMGGDEPEKALFAEGQHSLEWLGSAKRHPAVVSYSLTSLHTLLRQGDPRRKALKQAISDYVTQRALKGSCDQQCLYNGFRSPADHCTCTCHANRLNDNMCCAQEWGKAQLKFYVRKAFDLWGDYFSGTDAYVRVFFQGQGSQTSMIGGNNNPQWHETLDFGTVTLGPGKNKYELEVWDSEPAEDELLHRFWGELKVGGPHERVGYLTYGRVEFAYELKCAPALGGPSCHTYVPLRQPASTSPPK